MALGQATFFEEFAPASGEHSLELVETHHHHEHDHHSEDAPDCENHGHHCHSHCLYLIPELDSKLGRELAVSVDPVMTQNQGYPGVSSRLFRPPLFTA